MFGEEGPRQSYSSYKAEKFNKTKEKVRMIMSGISSLSLKQEDKTKLIEEIKIIVNNHK